MIAGWLLGVAHSYHSAGILAASISELSSSQIIPPFLHLQRHLANRICSICSSQSWEEMTLMLESTQGWSLRTICHPSPTVFPCEKVRCSQVWTFIPQPGKRTSIINQSWETCTLLLSCIKCRRAYFFSGGFHWRMTSIARTMYKARLAWRSVSARRFLADIHIQ